MRTRDRIRLAVHNFKRRRRIGVAKIQNFELTSRRSEMLARMLRNPGPTTEFERMVAEAIDRLPEEFQQALETVPVVVSNGGHERGAYGIYEGDTIAHDHWPDRIVIFQDTLIRDFGHDRELLRAQIERTVRHELAHHLGWNEDGVRGLGL
ncbi:MAG: metallopeptidase family protein [Actinobacteria bacterium]|nr:metallopeptidase family protein [Actinomycetota bacterium]